MIQMGSKLEAADNSGAKILRCVKVLGGAKKMFASIGDTIVVSVIKLSSSSSKVKKGDVFRAALVRTKKEVQRKDGSILRFDVNSAVLLNKQGEPVGTRVFGPLPTELRKRGFSKLLSLAPEIV
ncbi:50S ribosomal protein L14 [Candidatus Cyrtobacter comes]|uniref:Large ribosomal subunit protein uL14 n=1 Tax=Candidatus Cyrtobacter comes TaxID=675776 RepID=A0ABU5L6H8_9RICK|nr:50S ribosomal protein L14 [Candidatus Cyrtobacter comes]MDZ5761732.1 50S ribosomal protein L14 [Candidatus Cyrtobacter comes]